MSERDDADGPQDAPRSAPEGEDAAASRPLSPGTQQSLEEVLSSIRALVSAETTARLAGRQDDVPVLMLTADMLSEAGDERSGEVLAEGLDELAARHDPDLSGLQRLRGQPAPILDEEALRGVVNRIVREELQGELGDRISRNLRKLIRREIGQAIEERKEEG